MPGKGIRRLSLGVASLLVVDAALTVGSTGMAFAVPSAAEQDTATKSAATSSYGAAQAKDESSATLMARLQNRKIEVLDARTADSTTYALPSGELETEAYAGPIRVKQGSTWKDIDTSLSDAGDDLEPQAAAADINVSDGGDTQLASVAKGKDSFGLGWEDKLPTPEVKDSTASYDLGGGQTLSVTALAQGFSENIQVAQQPDDDSVTYRIPLKLDGLKLSQADSGHLLLRDADGKVVAEAPAPMMWDSSKDDASGESAHQEQVATKIETADDGSQTLVLTPDKTFLATATYPVTVDPTTTLAVTTDTWVQNPDYPDSQISSQELKSGTYDSGTDTARSYLKFDVSKFTGKHITSATMSLYSYYSSSCSSTASTQAKRVTSTLNTTTLTWGAQPSTTTTNMATNSGHWGYSSSCPANWSNWTLTSMVQDWANGAANNGIQLRSSDETDSTNWRRFRSANYTTSGYAPKLVVNYNSYPTTPTSVAVSPSSVNDYNGKRYVTSYTPTLSAKVSDPDGSTVKAQFEITNDPAYSGETSYSYTATSSSVSSGGTASLAIPSASQLAASHLRLRVRGYDGTDYGAWSSYLYFVPNVGKPVQPAISCSDYPSGAWSDPVASTTCTLTTTSSDGAGFQWGLDDKTVPNSALDTTDGSGGDPQTITIKPGKGWHTLYARTIDSGGNLSTSTTGYSFGVGKASLNSPVTGDTTDDAVTLTATQSGAFTGVTYQYRIGETDSWHSLPVTDVTKAADGSALSAWPLSFSASGQPVDLSWAAAGTLDDDGPVQVRALFTDGTNTYGTDPATVTVDRKADNAPTTDAGPGKVNELTGDLSLDATDASAFGAAVRRSFSSRNPQDAGQDDQVAVFGPNWTAGITAATSTWSYLKEKSSTSVALVDAEGAQTGFTLASGGGWTPQPGSEDLTLTGTLSGSSFTLKDSAGTTATFTKVSSSATTWQLATSYQVSDNALNTTTVVSQAVSLSDGSVLAEPKYVIAPTGAISAATCAADPTTAGCRVLEFVYAAATTATSSAAGDYAGQVKQLKLWATAPGASAATATVIESYDYTSAGQLADAWDPRTSPALKISYTYDSAGRVATLTEPGRLPWTFAYGKVGSNSDAGDGMLLSVSRPTLKSGTAATTDGGTATTSIVYGVPVSGSKAPYSLSPTDTATWDQHDNPVYGVAVFPPGSVPASHDGSTLGSGDYSTATLSYLDAESREVNTATPGGHIATVEYDQQGDTTRELSAANRDLALSTTTSSDPRLATAISTANSTADAADLLSTITDYTTGTDGAQLASDSYGPLHTITLQRTLAGATSDADLAAGSDTLTRSHTAYRYDENRTGSAAVSDLLTSTTAGATVTGYPSDADQQKTAATYDWTTGRQLTNTVDPSGLAITTKYTYDSDGRLLTVVEPTSSGSDAKTTVTTYWSATGSGTCQGRPEWAGLVCTLTPAATVADAGSNPSELVTKAYTYDRYGQVATQTETANSTTRTTTFTRDDGGRLTKEAITGGTGTATPDTTYTYDATDGSVASTTSNGQTSTTAYDELGRQISYDDGAGNTTSTAYDSQDRPVTVSDSAPSTTTYTYDATTGLAKTVTDSVAGTFTATGYDADGKLTGESLPGGYTLTQTYDTGGEQTDRTYADSAGTTVMEDTASYTATGQQAGHTEDNGTTTASTFTYDAAERLTKAQDDTGSTCTTRAYSFASTTSYNRTGLTATSGTTDCADSTSDTTTTTTTTHTYDSADRITDSGYTYDAFGRTTALPGSTSLAYYTNDLVRQETTSTTQQTWTLDSAHRLAAWTTKTSSDGGTTWTTSATRTNHYADSGDSPTWTAEDGSGTITRNVRDISGSLAATTNATGGTSLQCANLHGDIAVQLDIATTTATTHTYDEFGNTTSSTRYGWLGTAERSSDTPTGLTLMGARVYNPATGRFLQTDPVLDGSANAYEYGYGDPVNSFDLNGQSSHKPRHCGITCSLMFSGLNMVLGNILCKFFAEASMICSAVIGGLMAIAKYTYECYNRCFHAGTAAKKFITGFTAGLVSGLTFGRAKSLYGQEIKQAIAAARKPIIRVLGSSAWSAISRGITQAGL
ncbi:DNRLRE domain-containing protein [Streptomyces sp. NPDC048277]|uniref:DNRLRE domain-containing protein n=1 Tax=Streptomyces sp. NPDC048277 TaxID=3155027 RepID=UPI003407B6DB